MPEALAVEQRAKIGKTVSMLPLGHTISDTVMLSIQQRTLLWIWGTTSGSACELICPV